MKLYSILLFTGFFDVSDVSVPQFLELSDTQNKLLIGGLVLTTLVIFALSRAYETKYIKGVVNVYLGLSAEEQLQKEDLKLTSLSSLILIIAYFLSSWACWTLLLNTTAGWELTDSLGLGALIVLFITFLPIIGLTFTSWVTGEWGMLKGLYIQNIIGYQLISLVYFIISLIWFLNPELRIELFYSFISVSLCYLFIRWLKGIILSLFKGVPIYYIILYFCTLEILPIAVIYFYIEQNFNF